MTDYSSAIIATFAVSAVFFAAVVYVLALPSDLPVVQREIEARKRS